MNSCDRCGARAVWAWFNGTLVLHLCGHHDNENSAALTAQGWGTLPLAVMA